MNGKSMMACAALMGAGTILAMVPDVQSVQPLLIPEYRKIVVHYSIANEPAVVTVGVETNRGDDVWLPVDDAQVTRLDGDINKLVGMGRHTFTWFVGADMPDSVFRRQSLRIGVTAWATNAPPDYMVVDLQQERTVNYYPSVRALPGGLQENDAYRLTKLVMRRIPAAGVVWTSGIATTDPTYKNADMVVHKVRLSADYYIGVYPVTQMQYTKIMGNNPSSFKSGADADQCPVEKVSYNTIRGSVKGAQWPGGREIDADSVIDKFRAHTGIETLDLPTAAQHEFAARAGTAAHVFTGASFTDANMDVAGWCYGSYGGVTHKVGTKLANAWGLYDVQGNVAEFCLDGCEATKTVDWGDSVYVDPEGPRVAEMAVYQNNYCRVARPNRTSYSNIFQKLSSMDGPASHEQQPFIGLRLCCAAIAK